MHETAAAHEPFARILAERKPVERGEIRTLVAMPAPGAAYCRALACAFLTRSGVAGCDDMKSSMRGSGPPFGLHVGVAPHGVEEPHRPMRIEASACRDADADAVGFELLLARESRQRDLRLRQRERAHLRIVEHIGGDAADQRRLPHLVFADRGVARDHVRHLMRQHRGKLCIVARQRQQSARDVELTVGQREGVDRGRVEDGDAVAQVGPLRRGDQLLHHPGDQPLEPRVLIDAAIGGEDALVLTLVGRERSSACFGALGIEAVL